LPDGLFSKCRLYEHFTVFCYILWAFGIVRGNLVNFSRFGILYQEKSGNPADDHLASNAGRRKKTAIGPLLTLPV
jgi:hypothetical protein